MLTYLKRHISLLNCSCSHYLLLAAVVGNVLLLKPAEAQAVPSNDTFANSTLVTGINISPTGTNIAATPRETGEPSTIGTRSNDNSVWWSWTASKSGNVTISTVGSTPGFDTLLGVYTGSSVSGLTLVPGAENDDDATGFKTSSVTFNAVAGTTYRIAVAGYLGSSGDITLNINYPPGEIVATDFNKDGRNDILWQRSGARNLANLTVWLMDNVTFLENKVPTPSQPSSAGWRAVATADFNRDGNTDILWRHRAGFFSAWSMDGTTRLSSDRLPRGQLSDPSWKIVGTGDFDKDGNADILWRSDAGFVSVWNMKGIYLAKGQELNPKQAPVNQKIVGTGDFNRDGNVDILWRTDGTGSLSVWYMNGINLISEDNAPVSPVPGLKVVGTQDFDRDGNVDILLRNNTTGSLSVWYMQGLTKLNEGTIPLDVSSSWKIVGEPE